MPSFAWETHMEKIIVAGICGIAIVYLSYTVWRSLHGKSTCGGCQGCDTKVPQKDNHK